MVADYCDGILGGRKFANRLLFWRYQKQVAFNPFFVGRINAIYFGLLALQIRRAMHGDGIANQRRAVLIHKRKSGQKESNKVFCRIGSWAFHYTHFLPGVQWRLSASCTRLHSKIFLRREEIAPTFGLSRLRLS